MPDNVLEVRGLRKAFGGILANDDISFAVPRGSLVGLIGPNGSGKTTLFNSIAGQHPADAGEVRFDGRRLTGLAAPQIARLGLVRTFQQARVYAGMTCMENMLVSASHAGETVATLLRVFEAGLTEKGGALLDFVGLADKRDSHVGTLSYGQRKLLELAMALMSDPKMLLLDEPTAGVNPTLIDSVVARLRQANRAFGVTLLVIEHNMRVVMELADHIHCLALGRLLASGTAVEIRADARVIDAYLGAR